MKKVFYQILDVRLALASPDEDFLAGFHRNYGRFEAQEGSSSADLTVRCDPCGPDPFVEVDGCRQSLKGHPAPTKQVEILLPSLLMERVKAFAVLHAAVLGSPHGALALSGPSGAGKTTLAQALLRQGWSYFSDDFCPIHRETHRVHPFPRSLWVRPSEPNKPMDGNRGKVIAPLESEGVRIAHAPLPLRWLVCLTAPPDPVERIHLTLRPEGAAFLEALRAEAGFQVVPKGSAGLDWELTYPKNEGHGLRFKALKDAHPDAAWGIYREPSCRPDFRLTPTLTPLTPLEAARFLLREMKHEPRGAHGVMTPGERLLHGIKLLASTSCHALSPGELPERMALLQTLTERETP